MLIPDLYSIQCRDIEMSFSMSQYCEGPWAIKQDAELIWLQTDARNSRRTGYGRSNAQMLKIEVNQLWHYTFVFTQGQSDLYYCFAAEDPLGFT